jgi:hypothetical protein
VSTRPTAIEYPERLSRGLVLVKRWLLALPQYITVGLIAGMILALTGGCLSPSSASSRHEPPDAAGRRI